MKVFVPVSESLMERLGLSPDDLVPFELDYEVLRSDALPEPDPVGVADGELLER